MFAFAFAVGSSLTAAAEIRLDWSAPSDCPDARMVRFVIERQLDARLDDPRLAPLQVRADVEAATDGFALELVIETGSGTSAERLFARECGLFARLIALKASLLAAPRTAAGPSPPARSARSPLSFRAQAAIGTTPLPAPSFGPELAAVLHAALLRFELTLGYDLPRARAYPERPEIGATFSAWSAALRVCAVASLDAVELIGCTAIEGHMLRGEGTGLRDSELTDQPFAAALLGAAVLVPFTRHWGLWVGADVPFALTRPEFFVQNLGTLFRPPRLGVRGTIGVEFRLP